MLRTILTLTFCVATQVVAQNASITEFMARNATTLADEDGDFSDWIEVTASSGGSVNLGGWYLTDDPTNLTKWAFPAETLAAGSSIVVFASAKNRAVLRGGRTPYVMHRSVRVQVAPEQAIGEVGVRVLSTLLPRREHYFIHIPNEPPELLRAGEDVLPLPRVRVCVGAAERLREMHGLRLR